ncbi:uncharacterized protein UTRI_02784_B [Ustilago trichophora]|uniref:Effector family protein Eff1 n=1 Tax=Ustilago trichophora TaxID=86804 RepID=A0A5C3E4X0_9BASI|nr:uncharacterized protein UTRI_02784_B [Ustilago trichophora]
MRSISPLSFFLLLVFSSICLALSNEFWKSLYQVAEQVEPEAREYFLKTGKLPSESSSSSLPSTDTFRHPHGLQRWTPFARPEPEVEILQPAPPNHYVDHSIPSPSSQTSHGDHTSARTFQSNWIRTEPLHNIEIKIFGLNQPPKVLSLTSRQSILQQVADRYQINAPRDAKSQIHPLNGVLTPPLIQEAFGYPNIRLRHFQEDIFLVPRLASVVDQDFTKEHGGMSLTRDRKYHLYVWKHHAVQGGLGSVFQLVGAVETAITTPAIKRKLLGYQTGRKVSIIGQDSIFDNSLLTL